MAFKTCSKCKSIKPACFGHFYRQKATSDGYTSWCRDCDRVKSREYMRRKSSLGLVKRVSPEKQREYTRRSRAKNLEKIKEAQRESQRVRRLKPEYLLYCAVSSRIRRMIKGKHEGSCRYLNYSMNELRRHIERQFSSGMTWDNYGEYWHIDHIRPASSFDLTYPDGDGFKDCWSLSNLRPLLAFDNLSKGSKRTHLI